MEDENPDFERDENRQFRVDDKVYVIADNQYDIYEAEITAVNDGSYSVHYPEYPDDDTDVDEESLLPITERNQRIFEEQEQIRREKEREEEERKRKFGAVDGTFEKQKKEKKRSWLFDKVSSAMSKWW